MTTKADFTKPYSTKRFSKWVIQPAQQIVMTIKDGITKLNGRTVTKRANLQMLLQELKNDFKVTKKVIKKDYTISYTLVRYKNIDKAKEQAMLVAEWSKNAQGLL